MMIEAQRELPLPASDAWLNDAQILAMKLFKQSCSVRMIANPTSLDFCGGSTVAFIDHSSVTILARACFETYVAFHWIFESPDPSMRKFRHGAWRLGGLIERLKLHPSTPEGRDVLRKTRLQAAELKAELESSEHLSTYSDKHSKRLLAGDWRIGWSWTSEAIRSGFHEKYIQNLYSHFSGYAHSSYISSMQMSQAQSLEDQHRLATAPLQACIHVLARTIMTYGELFPGGAAALESAHEEAQIVVRRWRIDAADLDRFYDSSYESGAADQGER
ncbi:hypothetical protein AL062_12990 [Pseudomonas syringae pv. syringae]|uniref:DUF5677 domain-containing protein n=1 Tax=Pseudomonas syringae TaxID=317 RepID=UPI0007605787|nr:DUF5677 domain-containing protein [Pseudomonas syringae]KWS24566.1 hypothetical protein AL062_12990 [Pseudomonas syringae pv. syringae]